jgi:hypothetical protein
MASNLLQRLLSFWRALFARRKPSQQQKATQPIEEIELSEFQPQPQQPPSPQLQPVSQGPVLAHSSYYYHSPAQAAQQSYHTIDDIPLHHISPSHSSPVGEPSELPADVNHWISVKARTNPKPDIVRPALVRAEAITVLDGDD